MIKTLKKFHLACLAPGQFLSFQVCEWAVVSDQCDWEFATFKVATPFMQGSDDSEQFLFSGGVVNFSRDELCRGISNDIAALHQNSPCTNNGRIRDEFIW